MEIKVLKVNRTCCKEDTEVFVCNVGRGLVRGGKVSLPDIDLDFASDRRQELKEYLIERYNVNGVRTFYAGTFSTLKIKAVIKDVARVYKVPLDTVNYVTKLLDDDTDWTGLFKLAAINTKVRKFIQDYPKLIEHIRPIMGQSKAASIHASAVIITPDGKDGKKADCFDFLPLKKMDGVLVSEFDGSMIEELGLLKQDILSTNELTKLNSMIYIINNTYQKDLSVDYIIKNELEDNKTYRILAAGFTQNIFQFSSKGITKFIKDVVPSCIEDLIAINALYRPATLEIGATDEYVKYRNGDLVPVYNYGTYEATKSTYSILTYQEQFMSIAHTLGGFDLGKTDLLRKAIGKKNKELMLSLKNDFIQGAISNGCPEKEANEIWHKIELAGKYSFNRSHAAAYTLISFCSAWIKASYPLAFYTVALQWAKDEEIPSLVCEMEQCSSAKIVSPDINFSDKDFYTVYESNKIFWSLSRVRSLGLKTIDYILDERHKIGWFKSIDDFIKRVFDKKLNNYSDGSRCPVTSLHVKNLILSGCFDKLEKIERVKERFAILKKAASLLGFEIKEKEFPVEEIEMDYFWKVCQINVSGIGQIDYRRLFENSIYKKHLKGKVLYMDFTEIFKSEHEGRKVCVCAHLKEVTEASYTDKATGDVKPYFKLVLQQNNYLMEFVGWNEFYQEYKHRIKSYLNKVVILKGVIKYSEFKNCNSLYNYKSSIINSI